MADSLEAIYAELPELKCLGKCQDSCGPIPMSPAEKSALTRAGKVVPSPLGMLMTGHLNCPHLSPIGTCSVYAIRPLICRIWGMVEAMPCEWGCKPSRMLTDDEAHHLIERTMNLEA